MKYLLDTHTFLWFVAGSVNLPEHVRKLISEYETVCFLSVASLWEIAIKLEIGKLSMSLGLVEISDFCRRNAIQILPIEINHFLKLQSLQKYHSDPFDRLIISQAFSDNMTVLTRDRNFSQYPIEII